MTELTEQQNPDTVAAAADDTGPLPETVYCTQAFIARMPSQRVVDLLKRLEPDYGFGELLQEMPPRVIAFRWLLREHPTRDSTSLWLHAYDVEVAVEDVDPTSGKPPTLSPPFAPTTT